MSKEGETLRRLLLIINILFDFWILVGVYIGIFCYILLGIAPRYIGWPLAILAEFLAWKTNWTHNPIELAVSINLVFVVVISFYFQMKYDEQQITGDSSVFRIDVTANLAKSQTERIMNVWSSFTTTWSSALGVIFFLPPFSINSVMKE